MEDKTEVSNAFEFKVGSDLEVINKVIEVLGLTPSEYYYNPQNNTITTNKSTVNRAFIHSKIRELECGFLLGDSVEDDLVRIKEVYINLNSINIAHQKLYKKYKRIVGIVSTNIDHQSNQVEVTAKIHTNKIESNDVRYKTACVLINYKQSMPSNKTYLNSYYVDSNGVLQMGDKILIRIL